MRKVLPALLAISALAFGATSAAGAQQQPGVTGNFSLMAMVHTTTFDDQGTPRQTTPWDGETGQGSYSYASIGCDGNAPVNNISTNLTTYNSQLSGSRSPASTRNHPLQFTVAPGSTLQGTVALTACKLERGPTTDGVADSQRNKIFIEWSTRYERTSPEEVRWSGGFRIVGGTGVYRDISGGGSISGYFFCFAPEGCNSLGEFRDGQYTMTGSFHDPTVP